MLAEACCIRGIKPNEESRIRRVIESLAAQDCQLPVSQRAGWDEIHSGYTPTGFSRLIRKAKQFWSEDTSSYVEDRSTPSIPDAENAVKEKPAIVPQRVSLLCKMQHRENDPPQIEGIYATSTSPHHLEFAILTSRSIAEIEDALLDQYGSSIISVHPRTISNWSSAFPFPSFGEGK